MKYSKKKLIDLEKLDILIKELNIKFTKEEILTRFFSIISSKELKGGESKLRLIGAEKTGETKTKNRRINILTIGNNAQNKEELILKAELFVSFFKHSKKLNELQEIEETIKVQSSELLIQTKDTFYENMLKK